MQIYEFNTVIHNGIIHIPEHLHNKQLSKVKVILLSENISDSVIKSRKKKFSAMKLQTEGFRFNREDAHER
ncbi:MAG: hypothetical protein LBK58_08990 [Prevotellaceae bacterium]|jgi:hypothetical protein|nr:hypothetical protein [Prevotellaceae bacterium]